MQKKYLVSELIRWNKKRLLKALAEDRKRNRESNLRFIDLHVAWLKRTGNKDWSKRQKEMVDSVYKANMKLRLSHSQSKRTIDELAVLVKKHSKPSKRGFAVASIREDRDEAH